MSPIFAWTWLCLVVTVAVSVADRVAGATPAFAPHLRTSIPELNHSRQLIVVTAPGWNNLQASIRLFERSPEQQAPWKTFGPPIAAVVGAHGMAWGIGAHGTGEPRELRKREGDRRAPAGVFKLYRVFGLARPNDVGFLRFPYCQVISSTEAVDDPQSRYYNRIVDRVRIPQPDWRRSESMQRVGGRYRFGVMVEHNWEQIPGRGSCIFLHVWAEAGQGTLGCTAMSAPDLNRLLHWVDRQENPLLVQLPWSEYERLKAPWGLPALPSRPAGGSLPGKL
ncbi:MAG TPA: L,D-transpeptidase family protein [Chthoniobacterales bacterium]